MVKPKDAKVWNEDLVAALESRYIMCERLGKQQQYMWREGAEKIRAVRSDIYSFKTGRIVNLPEGLKRPVLTLCTDVIQGRKNVYPDGYGAVSQEAPPTGNPFKRHPYLKKIKARGGAYAILMAFHHSASKTLTKDEICSLAQPYCDEAMRENYLAGRTYGAWKAKDTLVRHGILIQSGARATYIPGTGFRANGLATFTLSHPDGKNFIEAMLEKFNLSGDAAANAPAGAVDNVAAVSSTPRYAMPSQTTSSTASKRTDELAGSDKERLRSWVLTARVNDTIDFPVGKARRKQIHDACDALQRELPGLMLDHSSSDNEKGNRRTLVVTLCRRPNGASLPSYSPSAKRPLFQEAELGTSAFKRARPDISASEAAANAAWERQAMQESLLESNYKSACPTERSFVEMERRAIEESLKSARMSDEKALSLTEMPLTKDELASRNKVMEEQAIRESLFMSGRAVTQNETPPRSSSPREPPLSDRKMPAKDLRRESTAKRTLFPTSEEGTIDLVSSPANRPSAASLPKDESFVEDVKPVKRSFVANRQDQQVIDLLDDDESPVVERVCEESKQEVIELLDDSQDDICLSSPAAAAGRKALPKPGTSMPQIHILIDNRERNRNATPRQLRMELTRLMTTGSLKDVWPRDMPTSLVSEAKLDLGDFAFDIQCNGDGWKRMDIAVERKRVSDLVQRSVKGDHWKQFTRMRDACRFSIFLIENDTRNAARFDAFGSQELEGWTPHTTLIDDEKSIFLFFGRALLSSRSAHFVQTKDEISSLRAVGALGLMAVISEDLNRSAATDALISLGKDRNLADRLGAGGIPWQLARQLGKAFGSTHHLESLYDECASDDCRRSLLTPYIVETEYSGMSSTSAGWSEAVYHVFTADQSKVKEARTAFDDCKDTVDDHGKLLSALHIHKSREVAVDSVLNTADFKRPGREKRRVCIDLSSAESRFFPTQTEESFFELRIRNDNQLQPALPTVIMQTTSGKRKSHRLCVHLLQAKKLVAGIKRMLSSSADFIEIAKQVAADYHDQTVKNAKDRRVILLIGLSPALDAAAKEAGYRAEIRVLVDLVLAQIMLGHDIAIIQAVRLSGDTELILQQLALACYHYHLLFQ